MTAGLPHDNAAERALRGFALGRKSWLFAGSDRAAAMATLNWCARRSFSEAIDAFRANRRGRVKLIYWDSPGMCLFAKRLEHNCVSACNFGSDSYVERPGYKEFFCAFARDRRCGHMLASRCGH